MTVRVGFEGTSVELCLIPTEKDGSKAGLCVIQAMRCMSRGGMDCFAVVAIEIKNAGRQAAITFDSIVRLEWCERSYVSSREALLKV